MMQQGELGSKIECKNIACLARLIQHKYHLDIRHGHNDIAAP